MFTQYMDRMGHKFDSPMSVYLYDLILEGLEDDSESFGGTAISRLGRFLVFERDDGFVYTYRYQTRERAEHEMDLYHEDAHPELLDEPTWYVIVD